AVRNYPEGEKNPDGFIKEVKENSVKAFENQEYPFERLVENLSISCEIGRNPLFDVMFTMQNMEIPGLEIPGLKIEPFQLEVSVSKFDITFIAEEVDDNLIIDLEYSSELFKKETISRIINYFKTLVASVLAGGEQTLSEINILPEDEKRQLLAAFNCESQYPADKTTHELFMEQVEKTPDRLAVTGMSHVPGKCAHMAENMEGGGADIIHCSLTYRELNKITNRLVRYLQVQGVGENQLVGILVDRAVEMIIGLLGILKTGCAYVPLNPNAPAGRNRYILDDCNSKLLVSLHRLKSISEEIDAGRKVVYLDDKDELNSKDTEANEGLLFQPQMQTQSKGYSQSPSHSCAYVLFTSGSTGKPKGALITHSNLSPLLHWGYKELEIGGDDRTLHHVSYYFDFSVWEIYLTLTTGASMYMVLDELQLNPEACVAYIRKNRVTVLNGTPTQWGYLVPHLNPESPEGKGNPQQKSLRYLFIGGETLTVDLVERLIAAGDEECRIINVYGPTETTIITTTLDVERGDLGMYAALSNVPIGIASGNAKLIVLDKYLNPVPFMVEGELYIGGEGVSLGYLNKSELTAERFIKASWQSAVGSRQEKKVKKSKEQNEKEEEITHRNNQSPITNNYFYRTVDRVRWLTDKKLEFRGRFDFQVKIRGFRIELGEIENQLLTHKNIEKAVVVAKDDENDETYLCAYYVVNPLTRGSLHGDGTDAADIRNHLSKTLPDYMIPVYFVPIDMIPLNQNGKVDFKALPKPGIGMSGSERTAPRDELEKKLVDIWSDVLTVDREKVGIDHDFFEMGGHSLKASAIGTRIHQDMDIKLTLEEILNASTVKQLAQTVKGKKKETFIPLEPVAEKEYYALSSAQKRLYILQHMDENSTGYNICHVVLLEGRLEKDMLENTFKRLIDRHEVLRTSFLE
ncbi:MAG: amino acid adenylation domain-containing protein, partial [bacterium]|nr:amino acid adenylation domain-containing protein [bacterium]